MSHYTKFIIAVTLLLSTTAHAGQINLYTDRQEVFMQPIIAAYEKQSGDEVKVLFIKKGLLERLKAESDASPADVILVKNQLLDFVKSGLTAPVVDDKLNQAVPANYRGNNWFTITKRVRALFTAPNINIQNYVDLAMPEYKGVCLRSGTHAYNIALFADMLSRLGEEKTEAWLQGVHNNLARQPQGKDRTQIQDVATGTCAIGIANSYYYFNLINRADDDERKQLQENVRMVLPTQPHINITGMALAKNAPNQDASLRFMRFLVSAEGQKIFASQNFEFPVRDDIPYPDMLEPYRTQMQNALPTTDDSALRQRASELVEEVNFNR